ncbi:MAG: ribosomal-processing cysteine protease Prp [Clostridia bacterium]|jgi:uncharacterized protein YsxB (DUF464 family)|nr:ribosomal-processing cysteine protease Prp [Clostridia bacterium]
MIRINIKKTETEFNVEVVGHALYAAHGTDIVCAAVSMLTINSVNSIDKFSKSKIAYKVNDGMLKFDVSNIDDASKVLIDSMILGLEAVKEEYGNKYIEINYLEV